LQERRSRCRRGDLVAGEEISLQERRCRCRRGDVVTKEDVVGGEEML
jgi:hypothetical protein